ncbi:type II secretion system protein [Candidatus Collierbacteria bacterium]|nr:type II secretion system protein [Candidatus Collierbacteria bacterium]
MKKLNGFTLIELVVSLAVLAFIISSGVNLFLRSLRDTSRSDLRKQVDERARVILGSLTRYFREAEIVSLSGQTRTTCLATPAGITGSSLVASDFYGVNSTFSISNGQLASASASTLILNPEASVTVSTTSNPFFTWYCSAGVPDRIKMQFRITAVGEEGSGTTYEDYVLDLTLRNTGK